MPERRTTPRKKFFFYMRVIDDDTQEILGHMVEVSAIGLQLETTNPFPINKDYYLRVELTSDLGDRPYIVFIGRTKWCKIDVIQPNLYHVGFEIAEIMPDDREIFLRILAKYGT
ncbi:MAG: PilZ domain-containing protein [Anaerolineales bacterium]|uniref:PilZ domain-containing protein n=1 Tax=Candidatus Villigracilis proximus TaxID=3140683 RepID=UPI0031375611|nr:PilZ domain-containing protein [Anaerolineales bacterium]MBK8823854.1 PilZ domain-containing protein [Anaerolineales bacterium]MBK9208170.1 PilZ domain-containing protein [Anaerolineales bacterium]